MLKGLKFILFLAFLSVKTVNAQSICMVTADYQLAENYIVIWEPFTDISNIDSVFIYRKEGTEPSFTKIGAVDVTSDSETIYIDETANTRDTTKYAISILNNLGVESGLSPWHQSVVLDYTENGNFEWTRYKKEDQENESYIFSYEFRVDDTGLGQFTSMGIFMNYQLFWFDGSYLLRPDAQYDVLTVLPECNFQTRANINTSRSNIKQQISNAAAGLDDNIKGVSYSIFPNPSFSNLTIQLEEKLAAKVWISTTKGEISNETAISNSDFVTLDVSNLAAGIYFANVEQNGVVSSMKFVKK